MNQAPTSNGHSLQKKGPKKKGPTPFYPQKKQPVYKKRDLSLFYSIVVVPKEFICYHIMFLSSGRQD
jgi:hypothetical protein